MALDREAVGSYIREHARPIDRALYDVHFHGGAASAVVEALLDFLNDDGGFGHGLEPDFAVPQSTALATTVAFQYLSDIGVNADEPIVQRGLEYLTASYLPEKSGWAIVEPGVDDFPHAPWWGFERAMAGFGWGNPSAEIHGYLLQFGSTPQREIIASVLEQANVRITELVADDDVDFHELLCFGRLYERADDSLRAGLKKPLEGLIAAAVNTDPAQWGEYGATPLTFAGRPDSSWADLFDQTTIDANLDLVERSIVGDHWEPTWDWGGTYPEAWDHAKVAWSGKITVDNLIMLQAFGRI